jgi:hypothetical protein
LKKRHWLGGSQKFLYPYPKISQFLCPLPPKKSVEKEALVGRITKVFIPKSKNFPIFLSKEQQKFVRKEALARRITKTLYPYQL